VTAPAGRYKWVALSNTTIGMLMATINSSIVLISLPAIFRGIGLDPLRPENVSYLLWMLMGYMVVTAVLVVSLGRIGDLYGRVRLYNLGFAVFTAGAIGLSLVLWRGQSAALALIGLRVVQGIGGAMIMANAAAILTDAFSADERGLALGINSVAAIAGSFIGLVVGGLLSVGDWHLIFLVSVPVGVFGTFWAFFKLREIGIKRRAPIDWLGNLTFGLGLILVLAGITYGLQPYGGADMGWTNPAVIAALAGGLGLLVAFAIVESRVAEPMFQLGLFRVPAFAAGNIAALLAATGRGGLMFMLIIWLQGIWLPLHGYSYESTPLWAAIYMLPMTVGFLIAGPLSGILSDRLGARPFATGGMLAAAATFGLMLLLPADFSYPPFAALLLCNGLAMGLFSAPNTAGIMNAVPADRRGVASGMLSTFQNAGMNLSIGLFFSLMVAGLGASLPSTLLRGLTAQGVPGTAAARIAHLPPVGSLFAAFLGYNPVRELLGPLLAQLPSDRAAYLTGHTFFPRLIAGPFMDGMHVTFAFAGLMMLVAAGASWMRGSRYVHAEPEATPAAPAGPVSSRRPVVVVSASHGAGGSVVGRQLATRLGVPFVGRRLDAAATRRLGAPLVEALAVPNREHEDGVARLLAEAVAGLPQFGPTGPAEVGDGHRERLDRAVRELARGDGCVIVGHGAVGALQSEPGVLRLRLDGPVEARVRSLMSVEGLDEAAARAELRAVDHGRRALLRHLYGLDPADPGLYHLVIDSTALPAETCVRLAVEALDAILAAAEGRPAALNGGRPFPSEVDEPETAASIG
jgi:MFS family permease/cytidylate kinase